MKWALVKRSKLSLFWIIWSRFARSEDHFWSLRRYQLSSIGKIALSSGLTWMSLSTMTGQVKKVDNESKSKTGTTQMSQTRAQLLKSQNWLNLIFWSPPTKYSMQTCLMCSKMYHFNSWWLMRLIDWRISRQKHSTCWKSIPVGESYSWQEPRSRTTRKSFLCFSIT